MKILPSADWNINHDRLSTFFPGLDLVPAPVHFVSDQTAPSLESILSEGKLHLQAHAETDYLEPLLGKRGIAFVYRRPRLEAVNGAVFTESRAIHEMAHGTFDPRCCRYYLDRNTGVWRVLKVGWGEPSAIRPTEKLHGWLIEEGFVEYLKGLYVAENWNEKMLPSTYVKQWGRLSPQDELTIGYSREELKVEMSVPLKYVIFNELNSPIIDPSVFAALVIEKLVMMRPSLFCCFLDARRSINNQRRLTQEITKIEPRLWEKLFESSYSERDFIQMCLHLGVARHVSR